MADKPLPTPAELRQLLIYEPETGHIYWRERPVEMFPNASGWASWNARCAGSRAGCINGNGYVHLAVNRRRFKAHRVVWAVHFGFWPDGEIDHINGVRTDNRIENLRVVDRSVNMRNKGRSRNNTSGVTGVRFSQRLGLWIAQIGSMESHEYLGSFASKAKAIAARKSAEQRHGYHPNHGAIR